MDINQELVSIIMPSYNSSEYISQAIESIINQSYTKWELLITDDCSTDDTRKIIEQYVARDHRIKLFAMDENSGAGAARNISIKEAKGRYIAFCDSDDCWKPEKLEVQLKFMADNKAEICFSSYLKFDQNNNPNGIIVAPSRVTYRDMIKNDYIGFSTCIYDTSRIGKYYMPILRKRQDWAFLLLLMKECPLAYGIKNPLACYRIRKSSLSRNKIKLVRYNVAVYKQVIGYSTLRAWATFLFVFMPHYFTKIFFAKVINR